MSKNLEDKTLYDKLYIEIQPTTGSNFDIEKYVQVINKLTELRVCKSENIFLHMQDPISFPTKDWREDELIDYCKDLKRSKQSGKIRKLFIVYYYNTEVGNSGGLYVGDGVIILFAKNPSINLILHEIGHAIGLVDRDRREKPPINEEKPSHCNDESCVMFWDSDSSIDVFCKLCRRDIIDQID